MIVHRILLMVVVIAAAGCAADQRVRPTQTPEQLLAKRDAVDRRANEQVYTTIESNLKRIKAEYDAYAAGKTKSPPTVEMLIISGGGDWGAFGAGFLKGWGKIAPGEMARPQFDAVTGVSTGALIAPFAFIGTDQSIEKVVHFYRNPQKDWVKPRWFLSFLMGGDAYADIPGLEREVKTALDPATLKQIADGWATGRILAINATNIDTEEMQVWDIGEEAQRAVETGNSDHMRDVLLASAAIPAVFPPRLIDGSLYIDGGVSGNILYGGRRANANDTFVAQWQERFPGTPIPKIRYWVIFNNEVRWPPEVVQAKWSSVLSNSLTTSTRAATLNSIRALFLNAKVAHLTYGADVEVRFVAVPDGWVQPEPGVFKKKTMNALADLGEKMGADPANWRTTAP